MSFIGPGSSLTYSFLVKADPPDGTYFPLFTVGAQNAGSIHYPLMIKVDSADIQASISQKPDNFALSTKDTVTLSIINPRNAAIKNIIVTPAGEGIDVNPSQKYISILNGQSSVEIPFSVTPNQQSNLNFHISYQNGDNDHSTDLILPVIPGENKKAASPCCQQCGTGIFRHIIYPDRRCKQCRSHRCKIDGSNGRVPRTSRGTLRTVCYRFACRRRFFKFRNYLFQQGSVISSAGNNVEG